jgi:hypothetical protein
MWKFLDIFNKAAVPKIVDDGFGYIRDSIIPRSDVTILSDIEHKESATMIADMFSPERIEEYSKSGVTAILLEVPEIMNDDAQDLFEKNITKDEFIKRMLNKTSSKLWTDEEFEAHATAIATAIETGSNQHPPIRFYMAQIKDTLEQEDIIHDMIKQNINHYWEAHKITNTLCDKIISENDNFPPNKADKLRQIADDFCNPGAHINDFEYLKKDLSKTLSEILEGTLSEEEIEEITSELQQIKNKQLDVLLAQVEYKNSIRVDNDTILAEKALQAKEETGGKVIIVHGAGHGAERHNDIDDILQKLRLTVSRINISYNEETLIKSMNSNPDNSEISFFPLTGELKFEDLNDDGKITGYYDENMPYSKIPIPDSPASQI